MGWTGGGGLHTVLAAEVLSSRTAPIVCVCIHNGEPLKRDKYNCLLIVFGGYT